MRTLEAERAKVVRNARLNAARRSTIDWRERAREQRERAAARSAKVDVRTAQGIRWDHTRGSV